MHFVKLVVLSLASVAIASPLEERQRPAKADVIIADINNIYSNIRTLNKTLNSFTPKGENNTATALKIQQQSEVIRQSLIQGTKDARSSGVLNENETYAVAEVVLDKLNPGTYSLLQKLSRKKHVFQNNIPEGDQTPLVRDTLIAQKKAAGTFGNATAKKLDESLRDAAYSINEQIQEWFDEAIANFTTTAS